MSDTSVPSKSFLGWIIFLIAFSVFQLASRYSLQYVFVKAYNWVYLVNTKANIFKEIAAFIALYAVLMGIYLVTRYLIKLCPKPKIGAILFLVINIGIITFSYFGNVSQTYQPVWLFCTVLVYSILAISLAMTTVLLFFKTKE
ncbi:MAG: hypothetical protein JWN56_472 [Sphingobacteriales bacterium]|nr:hypothetical protein [Sphingobacteriales bacterium]